MGQSLAWAGLAALAVGATLGLSILSAPMIARLDRLL
jgi:hypothetical protein